MFQLSHPIEGCCHCKRIIEAQNGTLSALIWESEHAIAVVGDHQYFSGYCMLISKHHVREMHDLPIEISAAIFQDLMKLGSSIHAAFEPWKLNYASLGNVDEHLHWHVFPRYENDPDKRDQPWKNSTQFANFPTSALAIQSVKNKLLRLHDKN